MIRRKELHKSRIVKVNARETLAKYHNPVLESMKKKRKIEPKIGNMASFRVFWHTCAIQFDLKPTTTYWF